MINIVFLFLTKVIDNILGTAKTILIQRNKGFFAGLTVFISQVIFYKLIDAVATGGNLIMYLISLASGIGTYLAIIINNKFSKEKTYVNIILSDNKVEMIKLRDYLKDNKITNLATDGYTKDWDKTIAITAYAETKEQSILIDKYITNSENKFKRIFNIK